MKFNLVKLARAIMKFGEIATDKATLICEGNLEVGVEVFIEAGEGDDVELVPAPDGDYVTEDETVYKVAEGKIVEVVIKDNEEPAEEEPEVVEEEDERDVRIAELEATVAERDKTIEDMAKEIEDLKAKLKEAEEKVNMSAAKKAGTQEEKKGALRFF